MASEILRFHPNGNVLMACHITGVYDINRNMTLEDDKYELGRHWAELVAEAKLHGLIFHNNFSEATCYKYKNEYISFLKIDYNPKFNPNVFRYFVYKDFQQKHVHLLKNIFVTDISDVVLVKNPFIDSCFIENTKTLFCGDEPKTLNTEWMATHSANLRTKIPDYADYETGFGHDPLLNCGIIGGVVPLFSDFIQQLCAIHQQYNCENKTAYTGDMGAFNYIARTQFINQVKHGAPINTVFKMYENERQDCWFRHK